MFARFTSRVILGRTATATSTCSTLSQIKCCRKISSQSKEDQNETTGIPGISTTRTGQKLNSSEFSPSNKELRLLRRSSIKSILETGAAGQEVRVQAWVRSVRKLKKNLFLDIGDGSTFGRVPVVLETKNKPVDLSLHSCVDMTGILVEHIKNPAILELHPTEPIHVVGPCDQQKYPLAGTAPYTWDYVRQYPHLRFKLNKFAALLRIRSAATRAIHDFFHENEYFQIHTPILTGNDCEGAGEIFNVLPANQSLLEEMRKGVCTTPPGGNQVPVVVQPLEEIYFDTRTFLSVSGQLHLEAAVGSLGHVWTFSPVFRAENNISTRHLSEFYMVEAEQAFAYQLEDILTVMERLIQFCIRRIISEHHADWNFYTEENSELRAVLDKILKSSFTRMTFDEACSLLKEKANSEVLPGKGLSREQEILLVNLNGGVPVFVVSWPKTIKPFYMRECSLNSENVSAVDLLVPSVGELCGGSLRENSTEILEEKLDEIDPSGKFKKSLNWYLEIRQFGGTPSGGFGLGFDRLLQLILGCPNIKDVVPFPRFPHSCLM